MNGIIGSSFLSLTQFRSLLTFELLSFTGMTILTLESELTRQQRENLMIVSTLASSLLTIIDDILDISKSESFHLPSLHPRFLPADLTVLRCSRPQSKPVE